MRTLLIVAAFASLGFAADPSVVRSKLRPPSRGFQLRMAPFTVPPGEREVCQAIRVPVHHDVDIDRITIRTPSGPTFATHHFAIFIADADASNLPFDGPVTDVGCVGAGGALVSPILAFVQRLKGDVVRFPKGVGVSVGPEHVLLLNSHYVNVGDAPVTLDVAVNFRKAAHGSVEHHAKSFQLGIANIDVPAEGTASVSANWGVPFPMTIVWASSHSHKHTTSADVDAVEDGVTKPLVHTTSYSEPDFAYFPPPTLRLVPGDAIRWTCNYRNTTDHVVTFGVTSEDEMCFAVGFFLTDDDGPVPPLPPQRLCSDDGLGLVCPIN